MKRILIGGALAVSLILLQPSSAPLADQKASQGWTTENDIKVLRLWKVPGLGPQWPQIALLKLTEHQKTELQEDPFAFIKRYNILDTHVVVGQFSVRLYETPPGKAMGKDDAFAVVAHGSATYSGLAVFEVDKIVD